MVVGDPRRDEVRMGPVVTRAQQAAVLDGVKQLATKAEIVFGGSSLPAIGDIDPNKSAFVLPTLLRVADAKSANAVHELEVFGPVATLMTYQDSNEAIALVRRGGGSLVASIFGSDLKLVGGCCPPTRLRTRTHTRDRSIHRHRSHRSRHRHASM